LISFAAGRNALGAAIAARHAISCDLVEHTVADELIIVFNIFNHAALLRSFELIAQTMW